MDSKFEKWAKIKEKGKADYIIKYGVLGWGVTTAILFSIVFSTIVSRMNKETSFLLTLLGLSLLVFPLGGIAWGYFMWNYMGKAYQKSKAD
ncbi:MAG: hypothetical protein JW804_05065 [Sedimentisphaerales bacterium]|nr:hypothetical protein [Sedimentisphaerales bacterium]